MKPGSHSIVVIGSINRDTVRLSDGRTVTGFGGILYNLLGFDRLLDGKAMLEPVCNLGEDVDRPVREILSQIENLDQGRVRTVRHKNNHCIMEYDSAGRRAECFDGFVPAIPYRRIQPVLDADLLLVNFISGRDISLKTLEAISITCSGSLYIDLHTLLLGLRKDGTRFYRRPRAWREYCACADYLQMNELEFLTLSGKSATETSIRDFYTEYLSEDVPAFIVTLGPDGATLTRCDDGEIVLTHARPSNSRDVVDTTGAGDLFSAGFCSAMLLGYEIEDRLQIAVDVATGGCGYLHPQEIQLEPLTSPI